MLGIYARGYFNDDGGGLRNQMFPMLYLLKLKYTH